MGDLSTHFSRHEFECSCNCGFDSVDYMTLIILEDVRENFGKPITVTSAARCFEWNRVPASKGGPGSNDNSQHPLARAVDFVVAGENPRDIQSYLKTRYPDIYGIGSYSNFTHLDTRTKGPARWQS